MLPLVIQYGFVVMFIAAFPLAPLFAFINNVAEIRLDAHKMIKLYRRPPALKAQDIGAWQICLNTISYLAVITNVSETASHSVNDPPVRKNALPDDLL